MKTENHSELLQQLDLLVDGELPEKERKNLLTELDRLPGGWKQCAVAFLEQQLFTQALRAMPYRKNAAAETLELKTSELKTSANEKWDTSNDASVTALSHSATPQWSNQVATKNSRHLLQTALTAICVSLAAFVLGGLFVSQWNDSQNVSSPQTNGFVQNVPSENHSVSANNEYEPSYFMNPLHPAFVNLTPETVSHKIPKPEYVTLSMDDSQHTAQIPCYRFDDIDAGRYLNSPPISDRELQRIIQRGGDVDVNRHNLVVPVGKNRHAVIPVDQIIVKYHGGDGML